MIHSATGMKSGERYGVESLERTKQFPGFFLDGKYYLGPELLTAVGWLEGQQFLYDELDAAGEPVFPDRVAGTIEGLTLTMADGVQLGLHELQVRAEPAADLDEDLSQVGQKHSVLWTVAAGFAVGLGASWLYRLSQGRKR
ncbi:hypothetical protein ACVW0A_004526 [Pseudomonas sp. TE3610]